MAVRVFVGGENFDELRKANCYYVDKTELLYELSHDSNNKVTLFTRPRRFGKTLTMRMIESFFDIRRDSRDVFEGLDIMKHEDFCAEWMNQYPVLFVTLKDAEGLTFEGAYEMLRLTLVDVCRKHDYLRESGAVSEKDHDLFSRLSANEASDGEVKESLRTLLRMMHAHFGKPVILLIDEYDVPLAKANEEKAAGERYYEQMLDVIRGMMSTALKSNDYLKFAVVTGCLRIARESIFTGVNNFESYSVLDRRFSTSFGFTEEEVSLLLETAEMADRMELARDWYDGYVFGDRKVFCPWDVINYVADAMDDPEIEPGVYWKNSSSNAVVRDFVQRSEFKVKPKFEVLLNGGTVTQTISDVLTYDTLHETEDNLWSVLLMTGYLTKADPKAKGNTVELKIPNREIATIFQDSVAKLFSDTLDVGKQKSLMDALWAGDEEASSRAISDFLWQTISYNDYHEDYYQAFLAGLFVGRGYTAESNKERGLGRPDIKLTEDDNRRILIIETKKSDSRARMEHDCDEALQQIIDREYAKNLDEYKVICYGIAFYQKSALVKKLR